jgi:DnaB-like helicase N terminal domain
MTRAEPRPPAARGRLRPVPEPDREPPHNLEAEEAVLGAVLASGRLLVEVAVLLEETDFYRPAHRAIWRALLRLADRGQPTDPVTVLGELQNSRELADVGGGPFLDTLVEAVPTVANAGHYARLVADTARRRRVIDLGIRLAHSDADPAELPIWPASWRRAPLSPGWGSGDGSRQSRSGLVARCPPSRLRSCPAGWGSTWPRSPPPPKPHPTWQACWP